MNILMKSRLMLVFGVLFGLIQSTHAGRCPSRKCDEGPLKVGQFCFGNSVSPVCEGGELISLSCKLDDKEYHLYKCTAEKCSPRNQSDSNQDVVEKGEEICSEMDKAISPTRERSLRVVHLPAEPNVISPNKFFDSFKKDLNQAIAFARNPKTEDPPHISAVTVEEARKYFAPYLEEKLTEEEKKSGMLDKILSPPVIGGEGESRPLQSPDEIFGDDPYLSSALHNVLSYDVKDEGDRQRRREYFERERKRFKPATLLMNPKLVLEAFKKNGRTWVSRELNDPKKSEKFQEAIEEFLNNKYFGVPEDPATRKDFFLKNDVGFLDHGLIENIYRGAKEIMNKSSPGDTLVVFGNSPYFVGRALSFLVSNDPQSPNYRKLIQFPFSGSPNRVRPGNFPDLRNLVTPERLAHLRERMRAEGLSSKNPALLKHDTHFIDVVASGAGFAYVAEEILRDFNQAKLPPPNLKVITMNRLDIHDSQDKRNSTIAKKNADKSGHTTLYFPSISNTHFQTDSVEVYIPGHAVLDMLPSDDYRGFPENNAFYWQKEFDHRLTQPHSNSMKVVLEYFDTNIKNLSKRDKVETDH